MQNARQVSTNDDDNNDDYDGYDDYGDYGDYDDCDCDGDGCDDYEDYDDYDLRCAWILIERPGSWRGSVLDLPKSRRPFVVTN